MPEQSLEIFILIFLKSNTLKSKINKGFHPVKNYQNAKNQENRKYNKEKKQLNN